MSELLSSVNGWVAVVGTAVGILVTLLVPLTGFLKEARTFETQKVRSTVGLGNAGLGTAGLIAPAEDMKQTVEAEKRVAAAVEKLTETVGEMCRHSEEGEEKRSSNMAKILEEVRGMRWAIEEIANRMHRRPEGSA